DDEIVGRNVLDGRWTFQIVEEFDDLYYGVVRAALRDLEARHLDGLRHLYESELKEDRRSPGRAGHEERPHAAWSPEVETTGDPGRSERSRRGRPRRCVRRARAGRRPARAACSWRSCRASPEGSHRR